MFRLEKLELNGFKSFSSPTEFTFGQGITAIVGPNGCGKSNIADAITWVIGEQGTRSLRAEHMGDVIFNGSDARRPMGLAEVSLRLAGHLDRPAHPAADPTKSAPSDAGANGDSAVLVERPEPGEPGSVEEAAGDGNGHAHGGNGNRFAPVAGPSIVPERREIVITRRLFRSGESEYLLDGQKCRLRDIQETLAEIHVGSGLYSVIEQGRVDSIITSRPRDRRVLIEEAAGIALYKVRKRQAQTKLDATEANLLRIHDIVSEIEKQSGSLKRQAARARRYARITAAIDKGERILFHHESVRLDEDSMRLGGRRVEVEAGASAASVAIASAEARLAGARAAAAGAAALHQRVREDLHALDRTMDQLTSGIDRYREQESEASSHIARGVAEVTALRERLAAIEERSATLALELRSATDESLRAEAAVAEAESILRLDAAALQATEAALAGAREETIFGAGALSECRNEIRRLGETVSRQRGEESRLVRLLGEVDTEMEGLGSRSREHESGQESLTASLHAAHVSAEEGGRLLREAESRRESLLLEREERRGRRKAIEERLSSLLSLDEGPALDLADLAGAPAPRLLKDLLSPPEPLDRAVDAALDRLLRGFLAGSIEESVSIVDTLKRRGRGRALLIPATPPPIPADARRDPACVAPGHPGFVGTLGALLNAGATGGAALSRILDRVAVASDIDAAIALRSSIPDHDIVTLQGDFLSRDGWMEGGAEIPEEAGVMTLKRLLERLRLDAAASRDRIAELDEEIGVAESSVDSLRADSAGWRQREAQLAREEEALRLQGESLRTERTRLDLRRAANAGDLLRVREDIAAAESERDRISLLLEGTLRRQDELQREAESLAGSVEAARGALGARGAAMAAHASAASAARERRVALETEARHHAETLTDLESRLAHAGEERVRWTGRLLEAKERLAQDSSTLADRMAERLMGEGAVASAEAALLERQGELPALEEAVRRSRAILDEAREALHAHALDEERLAGERRSLEARVMERGFPSLALVTADLTDEEKATDSEIARRDMASLRERRDGMGAVNLMAVDQFRELEERHAFITGQRRDLEESIRSLKETIARINRQSRERFLEAFERIRAGFGEIFKTLFGGGRADLRLITEGEEDGDLLEAGLEISAQPPGKRLQSISLLSGGEKALTAIALLFAIFRYSPSPFCLLDEVDAPLDEANVMRFNTLLRTMSIETQFVMITHNRRSMEGAGLLYGITMEEPGISRTVSVVMASEEDRKEAARTLPALLASRHRGNAGRARAASPAGHDA